MASLAGPASLVLRVPFRPGLPHPVTTQSPPPSGGKSLFQIRASFSFGNVCVQTFKVRKKYDYNKAK